MAIKTVLQPFGQTEACGHGGSDNCLRLALGAGSARCLLHLCCLEHTAGWLRRIACTLIVMARLIRIGANLRAAVASASWPGLSGPSVAARAGGDGPDKPGHDGRRTAVSRRN